MDEFYNTFLIPQMFAQVAQGKATPEEAVSAFAKKAQTIYRKVEEPGARLAEPPVDVCRGPGKGPRHTCRTGREMMFPLHPRLERI